MKNTLVAVAAAAALAGLGGYWFLARPDRAADFSFSDGADISAGAAIYSEFCSSCHGANLEGQPDWRTPNPDGTYPAPPHDPSGHTWHHDDAMLFTYTRKGGKAAMAEAGITDFESGMPAFEGTLSDQDIRNVLAYIESTWPERIRTLRAERNGSG